MAEIYLADIRRIAPRVSELQERLAAALPERARQAARFAREEDRLRSLAAGLLLQDVLGACTILFGAHGKPYVPDGPHFNLSHSGDYVLLAVDAHPVGVDMEKHAERDFAALARFAFHPEERERFGPDLQARAFFDIWTLKESYLKMRGNGLGGSPSSFAVQLEGHTAFIPSDPAAHLRVYELEGYSAAFCSAHAACPEKFIPVW